MKLREKELCNAVEYLGNMAEEVSNSGVESAGVNAHVQFWGYLLQ
jgi:hypothetical protein